jgi:hypothetical protein
MSDFAVGKLVQGNLREFWKREDVNFAPWLAGEGNIAALAEVLGLEQLDDVQQEVKVGNFSLDILAHDSLTKTLVAVENQYHKGNHGHLGQLITYAAGVSSRESNRKIFVWLVEHLRDEHRSALDWLNRISNEDIGFFGIELEVWQIAGPNSQKSLPALRFNVVCKPNEWEKALAHPSPTHELYLEFWTAFIVLCKTKHTTLLPDFAKPQRWMETKIGRSGFGVNLDVVKKFKRLECHLWIDHSEAKAAFDALLKQREMIVAKLGSEIDFVEVPRRKAFKIFETSDGNISNREQWPAMHRWLKERGEAYAAVFAPIVKQLKLD